MEKCEQMAKEMETKSIHNDDLSNVVENLLDDVIHKQKMKIYYKPFCFLN